MTDATRPVSTLFMLQFGSNVGYAISSLERLFLACGRELALGDDRHVHFSYTNLDRGRPDTLPPDFANVTACDFRHGSEDDLRAIEDYVRRNEIDLVVVFDLQPVHPLVRHLRAGGAATVISYIGGPVSSVMPWWKLMLKRLQLRLSRSKVDGMIFESEAMADLGRFGRGVPEAMIDVVIMGVDIEKFRPEVQLDVHEEFDFPVDRRIVVYAGHMERRKGVHVLVEAAIELLTERGRRDVAFLICGDRPGERVPFEAMYEGRGIGHLIRFGGYRDDLPALYPACHCGVIPSTGWDSLTYSSIEMAACGLPVIASRLGGLPEAVLDGETGLLFEPGDAGALADHIERLLDDPDLHARLARNGRRRCEKELNLDAHRERFVRVLRRRHDDAREGVARKTPNVAADHTSS